MRTVAEIDWRNRIGDEPSALASGRKLLIDALPQSASIVVLRTDTHDRYKVRPARHSSGQPFAVPEVSESY